VGAGLFSSLYVLRWPVENLSASEHRRRNTSALVYLGHDHRSKMGQHDGRKRTERAYKWIVTTGNLKARIALYAA
jgi:hypothetical protein